MRSFQPLAGGFLAAPAPTPGAQRLFDGDVGLRLMNASRRFRQRSACPADKLLCTGFPEG